MNGAPGSSASGSSMGRAAACGFGEDVGGEGVGEVVLADDDFYVDTEGVGWAEDFEDAASGGAAGGGEVGDLDVDGEAFEGIVACVAFGVGPASLLDLGFFAEDSVWGLFGGGGDLHAVGDEDGLGHALVERGDVVAVDEGHVLPRVGAAVRAGVVEDADDGGVAAGEDAGYSAGAAAFAVAWGFVDEDFVALHGSVDLVGRDEEVVFAVGAAVGADEGVAVAVHVDASGDEAVAGGSVFLWEDRLCRGVGGLFVRERRRGWPTARSRF